mmetsp:Transcript_114129/g.329681  ORF Transcript_114129/g.329681 Transcript_114129/m.329681 type:complete len:305 (-) Transcript_114129:1643-2557(-)
MASSVGEPSSTLSRSPAVFTPTASNIFIVPLDNTVAKKALDSSSDGTFPTPAMGVSSLAGLGDFSGFLATVFTFDLAVVLITFGFAVRNWFSLLSSKFRFEYHCSPRTLPSSSSASFASLTCVFHAEIMATLPVPFKGARPCATLQSASCSDRSLVFVFKNTSESKTLMSKRNSFEAPPRTTDCVPTHVLSAILGGQDEPIASSILAPSPTRCLAIVNLVISLRLHSFLQEIYMSTSIPVSVLLCVKKSNAETIFTERRKFCVHFGMSAEIGPSKKNCFVLSVDSRDSILRRALLHDSIKAKAP